jgi:hypothetical protein
MPLGLHPFYLLVVLAILAAPVVAVVAVVSAQGRGRPSAPPAYGLRSPDGLYWWDGSRWQPVPPADGPGAPPAG